MSSDSCSTLLSSRMNSETTSGFNCRKVSMRRRTRHRVCADTHMLVSARGRCYEPMCNLTLHGFRQVRSEPGQQHHDHESLSTRGLSALNEHEIANALIESDWCPQLGFRLISFCQSPQVLRRNAFRSNWRFRACHLVFRHARDGASFSSRIIL